MSIRTEATVRKFWLAVAQFSIAQTITEPMNNNFKYINMSLNKDY